jgi:orotidine-5'-phosphate decarboxylase
MASAGLSSTASGGTKQMIALLAICRKVIILDLKQTDASQTFALAAAILALSYGLIRDSDQRLVGGA